MTSYRIAEESIENKSQKRSFRIMKSTAVHFEGREEQQQPKIIYKHLVGQHFVYIIFSAIQTYAATHIHGPIQHIANILYFTLLESGLTFDMH